MENLVPVSLQEMARALHESGHYRVLRRFGTPPEFCAADGSPTRIALIVDVETTGLDPAEHRIIQFSALPIEYCPRTGRVFGSRTDHTYFEDPGHPLPSEIVDLTGITDAHVAGQTIDDAAIDALLPSIALVIAHNAPFDRRFVERRLPGFRSKPWACSIRDVPWKRQGLRSAKLEFLLYKHCEMFYDGHRADLDCSATLHVLATPFASGESPLRLLLESARRDTVRLWATDAPFDLKYALKARRYRWNNGQNGRPKAWYRDLDETDEAAECDWLRETIYAGGCGWKRETFNASRRYSDGF